MLHLDVPFSLITDKRRRVPGLCVNCLSKPYTEIQISPQNNYEIITYILYVIHLVKINLILRQQNKDKI